MGRKCGSWMAFPERDLLSNAHHCEQGVSEGASPREIVVPTWKFVIDHLVSLCAKYVTKMPVRFQNLTAAAPDVILKQTSFQVELHRRTLLLHQYPKLVK